MDSARINSHDPMPQKPNMLNSSKSFVEWVLLNELPECYAFHDFVHTNQVVKAAETIGIASRLSNEELNSVLIAAWFHDVGYIISKDQHEKHSAAMAAHLLSVWGAGKRKIFDVTQTILAVKIPQNPKTLLGMVLCDADMWHLGSTSYSENAAKHRKELELIQNMRWDDQEWLQLNIHLLTSHKYFTSYGKNVLNKRKLENLYSLLKVYEFV